jgi:CheY-like chemotaxis protein/Tfp pilus assembly protein PilZ
MAEYRKKDQFILVVDENDSTLSSICLLLNRFHYQILKATTEKQALATAAGLAPSLIVVSLDLPGMTGFWLIRRLKDNPSTSHIPVVGLIREDNGDLKDRCLGHGAAGYLSYPIEAETLYLTVQKAIEKNPRSSMRVRTVLPVKVYGKQCDSLYGAYTLALSAGGMFLRTMNPVSENTQISLEFDLNGRSIAAETVVLYNCQARGPCEESGIGLRFVDISPKDQDTIRQFIRNEVMKGIPRTPADRQPRA